MAKRSRREQQTNEQLMEEFLATLTLEGRSAHSVQSYRRDLTRLLAALDGSLEAVRSGDLREHFREQLAAGVSPSSVNHVIAATRSFFRFLCDEGRVETNPSLTLRSIRLGPPLAPKHLTVAEVEQLLLLPDQTIPVGRRDYAILMTLYNTGLRVSELCALNRDDLQLPAEGWGMLQVVGKGRRLRRVPLNRPTVEATLTYLVDRHDDDTALFLNRNGDRFNVRGIALLVNRCLQAIGITDRSGPHVLRHTFATHALRARPNLRAVQELLGHAWVTTTQRYTHLELDDLQEQVAQMPVRRL